MLFDKCHVPRDPPHDLSHCNHGFNKGEMGQKTVKAKGNHHKQNKKEIGKTHMLTDT